VSDGGLLTATQLAIAAPRERTTETVPTGRGPRQSLADWERQIVTDALHAANGNKSRAAALLGLTRSQLYTRLKRL